MKQKFWRQTDSEFAFQSNYTSVNSVNLGDILELASLPRNSKASSNNKHSRKSFINEVAASNKIYRGVKHRATRRATKTSHSSLRSLEGKGANEGAEGVGVRLIGTYPIRNIDAHGARNHKTTFSCLETAAGATPAVSGRFVLIAHGRAYHGENNNANSSHQTQRCTSTLDDRPIAFWDAQRSSTLGDRETPASARVALPRMPLRPRRDEEWQSLLRAMLTSGKDEETTSLGCKC